MAQAGLVVSFSLSQLMNDLLRCAGSFSLSRSLPPSLRGPFGPLLGSRPHGNPSGGFCAIDGRHPDFLTAVCLTLSKHRQQDDPRLWRVKLI